MKTRTRLQRQPGLACLRLDREMRRRLILQETWFIPWRFFTSYFIDVDTFYLFLSWLSTRVSDDQKYLCVLAKRVYKYTKNSRASIPEKLHHCQGSKKWFTWHVISIIAGNKSQAHHKTHLHRVKVYNTWPSRFYHSVVFTCPKVSKRFQAIGFVDRHVSEKL